MTMLRKSIWMTWLGAVLSMAGMPAANGATYLNVSRVIISEKSGEAQPQLTNAGEQPVLFQIWIDKGDTAASPEKLEVPFVVDNPVFRLDPGNTRRVRILLDRALLSLPQDRESLFWLNVLEVPASPPVQRSSQVQLAFQSRVKLMYRPAALPGGLDDAVVGQLRFSLRCSAAGASLHVGNPTAFHHTILRVRPGADVPAQMRDDVLRPGETISVALPSAHPPIAPGGAVSFEYINDFGAVIEAHGKIGESDCP